MENPSKTMLHPEKKISISRHLAEIAHIRLQQTFTPPDRNQQFTLPRLHSCQSEFYSYASSSRYS